MSSEDAINFIKSLREHNHTHEEDGSPVAWRDPAHIATDVIRRDCRLRRDGNDYGIACVELYLNRDIPSIELFYGIIEMDVIGVWFYDGDGDINDQVWRQYLIPWHAVDSIILHQVS